MVRQVCRKVSLLLAAGTVISSGNALPVSAQQTNTGIIQGVVTDGASRRPLPNAQVFVAGTTFGGISNSAGEYRIQNLPPGQVQVRVRLLGWAPTGRPATVTIGQTTQVDFALTQSAIELSEVVVTGAAGPVEERKLGNTVATIQPPPEAPVSSFSEILQGREPGLVGLPSGGLAGEGTRIRIRGNASLSQSNEPIVYVDGVRIDDGGGFGDNVVTGGGGTPSRLDDIDPEAIDRVEVAKGAAAATLYGTEASNGVIQIFTKRGSAGAPRWTFSVEQAFSSFPDRIKPNVGFARTQEHADSLSVFYGEPIAPFQLIERQFTDRLTETGASTTASAQVSGGFASATYFGSFRYITEDGPFGSDDFGPADDGNRKLQGTLNVNLTPRENLRLSFRTLYADAKLDVPNNNNNIYAPFTLAMFGKPEEAECVESSALPGAPPLGVEAPGRCFGPGNELGNTAFSTAREAMQEQITQDAEHFNGVVNAAWLPTSSLTFDATVGLDVTNQRSRDLLPFGNAVDNFSSNNPNGYRAVDDRNNREITVEGKGTWSTNLSSSVSSTLLAGTQTFITRTNIAGSNNFDFPGPFEVVGAGPNPAAFERFLETVNAGFFAQEQLGFADWIFATVGGRYDFNSAFGENSDGVFYPKASVSVIPSDREAWGSPLGLSTLRLRAAIGQAGRQPQAFEELTTFAPLSSSAGGGIVPFNLGNEDLEPEISTEYEIGAELGLFDNRAGVDVTYWNRTVEDALVYRQFPLTGGFFRTQLFNVGEMKAHGFDLSFRGYLVNSPNVSVDVFANGAYLSQEVTDLGGAPPLKAGGSYPRYRNFIVEGEPPGVLLGAKLPQPCRGAETYTCLQPGQLPYDLNADGVPDSEAEMLAVLAAPISLSDLNPIMVDEDGDGDLLDHYLGKPYPDWSGGFGGNITLFRNWRINTLFEYKAGNYKVTNLTDAFRKANPVIGRNTREAAEAEATVLNPASTPEQRLEAAKRWANELKALSPYDGLNQNDDGDFLRWRELSVTYTASPRLAELFRARDVAFTFGVRNLALWTKYTGTDPEINAIGRTTDGDTAQDNIDNNFLDAVDAFGFPLTRRYSFSVRVGF